MELVLLVIVFLVQISVVACVIWAIVGIIKGMQRKRNGSSKGAIGLAEERYAKGEISKNEFEEIKKVLDS